MKQQSMDELELRRYLLGELTQDERVRVEARLFLDDEYLSQLKAVEDELADEYAYDELTAREREKFESDFLAWPERRVNLRIAQALKRFAASEAATPNHASSLPSTASAAETGTKQLPATGHFAPLTSLFGRRPAFGLSLAAVALIALSLLAWLVAESWRRQHTDAQMQAHEPAPRMTEPAAQPAPSPASNLPANGGSSGEGVETAERQGRHRGETAGAGRSSEAKKGRQEESRRGSSPPVRQTPTQIITFLLLPGGALRGEGRIRSLSVSSETGIVMLKLPLADAYEYHSYRATLQTGGRPRTWDNLKPEVDAQYGRVVSVKAPASLFRQQSYRMELSGVTDAGEILKLTSYTFQVERK